MTPARNISPPSRLDDNRRRAARWLYSAPGQLLLDIEREMLAPRLDKMFGVHAMQLSVLDELDLLGGSNASHSFNITERFCTPDTAPAVADFDSLPIETQSLDTLLIHHVLEFHTQAHAILREAARVVRPGGQIMVVMFNPYSAMNLQSRMGYRWSKRAFRISNISVGKLIDWLKLLEFSTEHVDYAWPLPLGYSHTYMQSAQALDRRLRRILRPLGSVIVLTASKRTLTMTPVRRRWKDLKPGLVVPVMKPSTRAAMQSSEDD